MAVLIQTQPKDTMVAKGAITESLSVTATGGGSLSYQWKQAKESTSVVGATVVAGQTAATMPIPKDLTEGAYYYFCTVTDSSGTLNSNIATVTVSDFPEYITGKYVNTYIKQCSKEAQDRFTKLQVLRGITIPNTDDVLKTAQIELFMESI